MHQPPTTRLEPPGRQRLRWLGWATVSVLVAVALLAPASPAYSNDTPGNNGTVKIHDTATETEPIVHNEPHVCTFHLHFFFSDPEQAGTWEIQEWSPGDKGTVVLSGTYDTFGDGEDRQPEEGAYQLPNGHYKLFWNGDLDTQKHDKMKVFWVDCPAPTQSLGAATETPTLPPTLPPTASPTVAPTPTFGQSLGAETSAPTPTPGSSSSFGQSLGAETNVPGVTLPPTSSSPVSASDDPGWRALLIGLAFLVALLLVADPSRPVTEDRRR
jgi:hypothetical protein